MNSDQSTAEAMAEMFQSVLATPNHRRRLRSRTFWEQLGCKKRTPALIEQVRGLFEHHGLSVTLRKRHSMDELRDIAFGSEDKSDWIVLTHQQPVSVQAVNPEGVAQPESGTTPRDEWFANMNQVKFGSESDVVVKFVVPLFEKLGYEEPDTATQHTVVMYFGLKKFKDKKADVVLFKRDDHVNDTHSPQNNLILAESKKLGKLIDPDVVGQARSYAMYLSPVYYFVTSGDAIEIWLYQMTVAEDVRMMAFKRTDLKQNWPELFGLLCKKRVMEIKEKRRQIIATLKESCLLITDDRHQTPVVANAVLPTTNVAAP